LLAGGGGDPPENREAKILCANVGADAGGDEGGANAVQGDPAAGFPVLLGPPPDNQKDRSEFHGKTGEHFHAPNETKMSDGGRGRASLGVEMWKSSQKSSVRRSAVRSIAWLGLLPAPSVNRFRDRKLMPFSPEGVNLETGDRIPAAPNDEADLFPLRCGADTIRDRR